jgi:tetratricopeptide (TPR) repeat protein
MPEWMDAVMGANSPRSRGRWAAPLFVIFIGALAYSNSLYGPFIYDDIDGIVANPQIRSLNPYRYSPAKPTTLSGRPMLVFSFAADYALGGIKVGVYHFTNVSIHLVSALLLYGIVRRSLSCKTLWGDGIARSATWLAAFVAAMWAAHPLATQAVTYIVQRAESLASMFLLASIYCLIRSANGSKWWRVGAVAACGLGMASKEIVGAAPVLAILYDRTFLAGSFRQAFSRRWKIYLGMAVMWGFVVRAFLIDSREGTVGFGPWISPAEYARTELNVIAHYLRLAFWPVNLVLDYYDWPIARNWSDVSWQGWLVLGILIGTMFALKYKPWLGFLGAWFFLILAPSSSILPIVHEPAAEQRMYLPLAALVSLVVVGGWAILGRRRTTRWAAAIAGCLLIALLVRTTMTRNDQYATVLDIWTDTVAKRPNNTRARANLGAAWVETSMDCASGSPAALWAARQAKDQFQIVLAIDPNFRLNVFALAEALERSGDPAAAENLYTQSLAKSPEIAGDLLVERGKLRVKRKDWVDAKADFFAAIQANPADVEAHYCLGVLYQQLGDWIHAESELVNVVAISPNYKDAAARLEQVRKLANATK